MKIKRVITIAKKSLRQVKHDKRTLGMIVVMPIVLMTLFFLAFAGEVEHVKVKIIDMDESDLTDEIIANINTTTLDINVLFGDDENDVEAGKKEVEDGKIWAVIIFPANFEQEVKQNMVKRSSTAVNISLIIDKSTPHINQAIYKSINDAIKETLEEKYGINATISISEDCIYGEHTEFIDYYAPGIIGFVTLMMAFMLTIISITRERTIGTLDRTFASPISSFEVVFGYMLAFGIISVIQSAIILTVTFFVFDVTMIGNILLVFITIILLAIGTQGLAILLSIGAKSEFQAVQFMPLIIFPSLLLAGVFWPTEAMPSFIKPFSQMIPLTYAVDALRGIMIRGCGFERIGIDIFILGIYLIVFELLSIIILKRKY